MLNIQNVLRSEEIKHKVLFQFFRKIQENRGFGVFSPALTRSSTVGGGSGSLIGDHPPIKQKKEKKKKKDEEDETLLLFTLT